MKVNLTKPSGTSSPGAAASKNEIVLFESQTVSYFPPSDENGVVMTGNIQMAPNEIPITIYSTKSKTEAPMETEGDEDTMSFKSSFKAQVPGNTKEIKEFVQYWTGRDIFLAHKACGENFYEFMGTPCAPLQLKSAKQDNNDARLWNLEFMPFAKSGFVPKIYEGTIPFSTPTDVATVTAIALTPANGVNYQLPSFATTASIGFGATTLDNNKVVSLIGGGGVAPATLANGTAGSVTVILNSGTTWTALNKSILNLKIFKSGATTYLIEQSRT